ncbi:MAG: serine/threonine protein kinase, partial [bacterium]
SHCRATFEDREYDLICMPFYGSVTLKTLIDHENWGLCFSGRDIQLLVRSIDHESLVKSNNEINLYDEMSGMSFAQAIAWWGACLAEAMHHAHQRRVLHRDIKPTNILITADGDPMLLDFNLAMQGPGAESAHQKLPNPLRQKDDSIGGTLAYMAPEHLEAMISGQSRLVDHRADIFSLGAVLYEALTRSDVIKKSHAPAENRAEMLQQALELRKIPAIPVRDIAPDVPYVLDKVIRKCIDPNPARRYTNAFELSEDLRAIARDLPLKYAGEPISNRIRRICRQNARTFVALSIMAILMFVGPGHSLYQNLEQDRIGRLVIDTQYDLNAARDATQNGNYNMAYVILRRVTDNLAQESALAHLQTEAKNQLLVTSQTQNAERKAADFIKQAAWERYRIIHSTRFGGEMNGEQSITQVMALIDPIVRQLSEIAARNVNRNAAVSSDNWVEYLTALQISDMTRWMDILLFDAICSQFRLG